MLMERTEAMPTAVSGVHGDAPPVNEDLDSVFAVDDTGLIADKLVRNAVFMGIFAQNDMVIALHLGRRLVQDGERLRRQRAKVRPFLFDKAAPAASGALLERSGVMLVEQLPDTPVQGSQTLELLSWRNRA